MTEISYIIFNKCDAAMAEICDAETPHALAMDDHCETLSTTSSRII